MAYIDGCLPVLARAAHYDGFSDEKCGCGRRWFVNRSRLGMKKWRKRINTMPRLTNSQFRAYLKRLPRISHAIVTLQYKRYKYIAFISDAVIAAHCDSSSFPTFDQLALPRRHNLTLFSQHYSDLIAIFQCKAFLQAPASPPPWTISNHRSLHSHIMPVDPTNYNSLELH